MPHYKIVNITGKLPKRHMNKDISVNVEYHVGFQKKFSKLKVNDEILLTCKTLPVSIHQLRIKGLITIAEISENEFVRLQKPSSKIKTEIEKKRIESKDKDNVSEDNEDNDSEDNKTKNKSKNKKSISTAIIKED